MKKVIFLFSLLLLYIQVNAQKINSKALAKKWYFDLEVMKPIIQKELQDHPELKEMDETTKETLIQSTLNQMSQIFMNFEVNGKYTGSDSNGELNVGNWLYDKKSKTITITEKNKEQGKFSVISITDKKLHLKSDKDSKELFLYCE